ncbi:hypothetical protein [Mucilaginibacter lacusdianchii]|uniref:hypothetical protein n=1 Tax=Mucilaginibacter lacusdianchii TaxID=2684211 RepID=UPI00131E912E|nr:hypothetical protein [Mucilaginibacter sp. JXJ CY 39]
MNTEPERFEIPSAPKGIRGKILAWIKRFLPAELIGSGLAIAASNLTLYLTHNKVIAAYVAATADTIGFYMVITLQSVLALRRQLHHSSQKFSLRHTWQVFKNL